MIPAGFAHNATTAATPVIPTKMFETKQPRIGIDLRKATSISRQEKEAHGRLRRNGETWTKREKRFGPVSCKTQTNKKMLVDSASFWQRTDRFAVAGSSSLLLLRHIPHFHGIRSSSCSRRHASLSFGERREQMALTKRSPGPCRLIRFFPVLTKTVGTAIRSRRN